jgi:hypothetical protein
VLVLRSSMLAKAKAIQVVGLFSDIFSSIECLFFVRFCAPKLKRLSHEGILSCKFCKVGLVGLSYFSFSLNLEDKISWR